MKCDFSLLLIDIVINLISAVNGDLFEISSIETKCSPTEIRNRNLGFWFTKWIILLLIKPLWGFWRLLLFLLLDKFSVFPFQLSTFILFFDWHNFSLIHFLPKNNFYCLYFNVSSWHQNITLLRNLKKKIVFATFILFHPQYGTINN